MNSNARGDCGSALEGVDGREQYSSAANSTGPLGTVIGGPNVSFSQGFYLSSRDDPCMSSYSRRATDWLESRPAARFVVATAVPGLGYIGSQLWLSDQSFEAAAPLGVTFGLAFALVMLLLKRLLGD